MSNVEGLKGVAVPPLEDPALVDVGGDDIGGVPTLPPIPLSEAEMAFEAGVNLVNVFRRL